MYTFLAKDWSPELRPQVRSFLSTLEEEEGDDCPLTLAELEELEKAPSFRARAWFLEGTDQPDGSESKNAAASPVLAGFAVFLEETGPELFTACLPDHREMSLFFPMMRWADALSSQRHPDGILRAWAWEHDICTPYLLLRLNFSASDATVTRGENTRVPYTGPVGEIERLSADTL